jgi:hypothetical protein
MGRGFAWLDTGTMESLLEAAEFVHMVEKRQAIKISAPEEIAYRFGWITTEQLLESATLYGKSPYGEHLRRVAEDTVTMLKTEYGTSYPKAVNELCSLIRKALELSVQILIPEPEAMDQLRCNSAPGILAGAVYAAVCHPKSLDEALIAAVNHSGDSAAVGALAGALVGALVGADQIHGFYLEGLEPAQVLETLAYDMFQGCPMEKMSRFFDIEWEEKYIAPGN